MCVRACGYMHIYVYVCMQVQVRVHVPIHEPIWAHTHMCMCRYMHAYMHHVCACVHASLCGISTSRPLMWVVPCQPPFLGEELRGRAGEEESAFSPT